MACYYIVRATVAKAREKEWVQWMLTEHIPKLISLPYFSDGCLLQGSNSQDNKGEFIAHYTAINRLSLDSYFTSEACAQLRNDGVVRFGDDVRLTREIWESIE